MHGSNGEANLELDEQYLEYKLIIKELLFNGASREVKTNEGATAADILEEHEEIIPPKYYNSLSFILS